MYVQVCFWIGSPDATCGRCRHWWKGMRSLWLWPSEDTMPIWSLTHQDGQRVSSLTFLPAWPVMIGEGDSTASFSWQWKTCAMEIHHLFIVTFNVASLLLFRVSLRKTMFLNKMMLSLYFISIWCCLVWMLVMLYVVKLVDVWWRLLWL